MIIPRTLREILSVLAAAAVFYGVAFIVASCGAPSITGDAGAHPTWWTVTVHETWRL